MPSFCTTRAAIGTAETPAAPLHGFTLPFVNLYISLPIRTPAAVPIEKAKRPRTMIFMVVSDKNYSPFALAPTVTPKSMVTMYIMAFCSVSVSFGT